MNSIMVDIETLGTNADAVILSIGALQFDLNTGKTGEEFLQKIDPQSCIDVGGTVTWGTLEFWMNQDEDAVKALSGKKISIKEMLHRLTVWIENIISDVGDVKIWAKGIDFDISIINYYYWQFREHKCPWKFWNVRDVRTLVELYPGGKAIEKETRKSNQGVAHSALDDCKVQVEFSSKIYQLLNEN